MFGFKKNSDVSGQEVQNVEVSAVEEDKKIADILGVKENDTNITAGVDAVLDEQEDIHDSQDVISQDDIDLQVFSENEKSDTSTDTFQENETEKEVSDEPSDFGQDETQNSVDLEVQNDVSATEFMPPADETEDLSNEENLVQEDTFVEVEPEPVFLEPEPNEVSAEKTEEQTAEEELEQDVAQTLASTHSEMDPFADYEGSLNSSDNDAEVSDSTVDGMDDDSLVAQHAMADPFAGAEKMDKLMHPQEFVAKHEEPKEEAEEIVLPTSKYWKIADLDVLSDNSKIINCHSAVDAWHGDQYQNDLKIEVETLKEMEQWSVTIVHSFSIPLTLHTPEIVVDKDPEVIRYATLACKGEEKLQIFNQRSYKFIRAQDDFFSVQGNVICGQIDDSYSLNIHDYYPVSLRGFANKTLQFVQPASGFICGPNGVRIFFGNAQAIGVCVHEELPEADVFEYEPSLKDFDSKASFVYSKDSPEAEFIARGKQKCLVVNVGSSFYGWNVRFDNEVYMSLRDVLTYQAKNKGLPSVNGELIYNTKVLKFFGVESLQARENVVYYSYGRM